MKRFYWLILLVPGFCFGAPFDLLINQKNIADSATFQRVVHPPELGVASVMGLNPEDNLPVLWKFGPGMGLFMGEVVSFPSWNVVQDKPIFSPVATSGDYNDLINKPSGSQVNSDWNATSGVATILNKPALALVATSGAYSDLSGLPPLFNGAYSSLTGIPSTFAPAAHTQPYSTITGTPTTVAGAGLTDAVTTAQLASYATTASVTAGLATKFNTPAGTAAQYVRGDGALATLPVTPAISINDSPGRSMVTTTTSTGFQVSATRPASVCYEGSFSTTSTIGGPSSASVFLETADTNSTTAGDWTIKAQQTYTNTITLAVVLNQVQGNNWSFCRYVPAGKYVRIRMGSVTGTASATINATQQEVLN